jgi:DNA repair exonuclease SbcCD ATPase subunit
MKIRSLELRNFRKFVGAVRVDGIGDGVNILVGPNEYGKSTLLEAINGVIFEKATAQTERARGFRHFCNGTAPQVELAFDLDGTRWTIAKRFAGHPGKATLADANGRRFEGDAAESELRRLLGFTRGARSEVGIWGTLWVQQGRPFGDMGLDEHGRHSLQGCLETQVGIVTGGQRGQRIPAGIENALLEIQTKSTRAPRGKFKDAIDRLDQTRKEIGRLEGKRDENFGHMDELSRLRRDRGRARADWDTDAHRRELNALQARGTAAAIKAAKISAARSAANFAQERAERAKNAVTEREGLIAELGPLETEVDGIEAKFAEAETRGAEVKRRLDAAEGRLAGLRQRQRDSGEKARRLERVRAAQAIASEIEEHRDTLRTAAELRSEVGRLTEAIGANPAADETVSRAEDATAELAGARAAVNAVATTISFSVNPAALARVHLDGKPLAEALFSVSVVTRSTIAVDGVGEIAVEPQIAERETMLERLRVAEQELRAALEAAGAKDLPAARRSGAQRRDLVRQRTDKSREIRRLAPVDRARQLPAGLEARENRVSELQGRLAKELELLRLASLPKATETEATIVASRCEGDLISAEIETADAAVEGPKQSLAGAVEVARNLSSRLAGRRAVLVSKQDQLAAGRSRSQDDELVVQAEKQADDAAAAQTALAELERDQTETVDEIDIRIRRAEAVGRLRAADLAWLNNEITRLETRIEENEGDGVEEALDAEQAKEARLKVQVKAYEGEAAVLGLLRDTLRGAESEAKQLYLAPVAQRAGPYLKMLLPGTDLRFDEALSIDAIERRGGIEAFACLSAGTQEQLAVLTRLAFAELLLDQGRPATIILDDPLVFSDDDRIERMFDILMRAGEKVQIIVLTCRRRLFARLGAPTLQIKAYREAD